MDSDQETPHLTSGRPGEHGAQLAAIGRPRGSSALPRNVRHILVHARAPLTQKRGVFGVVRKQLMTQIATPRALPTRYPERACNQRP
jgi:hypothetical protein